MKTAPPVLAIITTSQYKTYAGLAVDTFDAQLDVLIPAIQARLERLCGRTFDYGTFTEYLDGAASPTVGVSNTPIVAVTSVALIDRTETVVYTYPATGYKVDSAAGLISRQVTGFGRGTSFESPLPPVGAWERVPQFPDGWRNVKVVYTGGYGGAGGITMPPDLQLLMYQLVDTELAQIKADRGMKSETLGHYSYTRVDGAAWAAFAPQIAAWKRVRT